MYSDLSKVVAIVPTLMCLEITQPLSWKTGKTKKE